MILSDFHISSKAFKRPDYFYSYLIGEDQHSKQKVWLKLCNPGKHYQYACRRLRAEETRLSNLKFDNIPEALTYLQGEGQEILVFKADNGEFLSAFHGQHNLIEKDIVKIGIEILNALEALHQRNLLHLALRPDNIIWDSASGNIKLWGIDAGKEMTNEKALLAQVPMPEEISPWMAPEQTGNLNLQVDVRTDLYGLGACLYFLCSGKSPFEEEDPLKLSHRILASEVPSLSNASISSVFAQIIHRLLEKGPDRRYQSIQGIKRDLELLAVQIESSDPNRDFVLGRFDTQPAFELSNKLFGRGKEVEQMASAYSRVMDKGAEVLVLNGASGLGKTMLWEAFSREKQAANGGFFVKGRFEAYNKDIPFQAWMEAFGLLLREILTEDQAALDDWKATFTSLAGGNLGLLKNSLPELSLFIEQVEPQDDILPVFLKSRFQLVFREFIKVFCKEGEPLVIFLDDFQWADASSVDLINALLADPEVNNLLIILGYNHEIAQSNQLFAELQSPQLTHLSLKPFTNELIADWLQDSVEIGELQAKTLAAIALDKTMGNPFYIKTWLQTLVKTDLITWDAQQMAWSWDIGQIKQASMPDDMAGLLMQKVQGLPEKSLEILNAASCLGKRFSFKELKAIASHHNGSLAKHLDPALDLDIVRKIKDSPLVLDDLSEVNFYEFSNPQVQSILYQDLVDANRAQYHLKIGLSLMDKNNALADEELFTASNHLLNGDLAAIEAETRLPVLKLLSNAGRKMMRTGAFVQALKFLTKAKRLVNEEDWENDVDQLLSLYTGIGECQFVQGNIEEANEHFDLAIAKTSDAYSKAKILYRQMGLYNYFEEIFEGQRKAMEGLRLLGQTYHEKVTSFLAARKLLPILLQLSTKRAEKLIHSKKRASKEKALAIDFLIEISAFNYDKNPTYSFVPILDVLNITLKHGLAEGSPFAIAALGGVHLRFLGSIERARKFWDIADRMIQEFPNHTQKGRVQAIISGTMENLIVHTKRTIPDLARCYQTCVQDGDLYWSYSAIMFSSYAMLNYGHKLSGISDFLSGHLKTHFPQKEDQARFAFLLVKLSLDFVAALRNRQSSNSLSLDLLDKMVELNNKSSIFQFFALDAILAYYSGETGVAWENAQKAEEYHEWAMANLLYRDFMIWQAIIMASEKENLDETATKKALKTLKRYLSLLEKDASNFSEGNFRAKALILRGVLAYFKGKSNEAATCFIQAKYKAEENGMVPDAAIAAEWAGKIKLELGENVGASQLLRNAHTLFSNWENFRAANTLQSKYPGLIFGGVLRGEDHKFASSGNGGGNLGLAQALSMTTIERVSTVLASERYQKPLLEKFLSLIMEHAGASAAAYFSYSKENFWLEAQADLNRPFQSQDDLVILGQTQEFPRKIIRYVGRAKEYLVIDHPDTDPRFADDVYLQENSPLSVLCYPLVHAGKLQGILYAENKFIPGAFSQDNLQLLKLISGQMSLSIENAQANELLEDKVKERTIALAKEQERSEGLLLNILPEQVAEELKEKNKATPRYYAEATVLFTDFVGFTKQSEQLSPEELVSLLDQYFSHFDQICAKYNIEKIKTIGDAFLCVGGLPTVDPDHAIKVAKAALEMRDYVREKQSGDQANTFDIRLGIHTGPLIAGVVGIKKFSYDIWGDTVNIASRMESNSEAGKINISASTYERIQDQFRCKYRGKIEAKGKGLIDMYYLEG